MQRLKAFSALLLTAFFAVAGSFHHHAVPTPTHDHAGFCSAATSLALESCAICKAAQTTAHLAIRSNATFAVDCAWSLPVAATFIPAGAGRTLLPESRAPPLV